MKEDLFVFVVSFFANWGWQTLGKVPDLATGKEEKNLNMAKQVIDILEMLQGKTKGNLNEQETKILDTTISELQLNYVEEVKKEKENTDKGNEKGHEKESEESVEKKSVEKESGEEPKKEEPEKESEKTS